LGSIHVISLSYDWHNNYVFYLLLLLSHTCGMDIATAAVEVTRPLPPAPRVRIAGRHFVFLLSAALCLTPWATPPLALALGAVLALTLESPFSKIGHRISKGLLQACVVLLALG